MYNTLLRFLFYVLYFQKEHTFLIKGYKYMLHNKSVDFRYI